MAGNLDATSIITGVNVERARRLLLSLPHAVESMQWGGVVFWVGDKAVGGRMFAMIPLDGDMQRVISYAAGAERFAELVEQEGFVPAPYLARAFWVAAATWGAHRDAGWEEELRAAHGLTQAKLPPKVRKTLELPAGNLKKTVAERRAKLAEKGRRVDGG